MRHKYINPTWIEEICDDRIPCLGRCKALLLQRGDSNLVRCSGRTNAQSPAGIAAR